MIIRLARRAVFPAISFISRPHPDIYIKMAALPNPAGIVDLTKNCPSGQLPPTAVAVSVLSIGQLCGGKRWYGTSMLLLLPRLWL